MNRFLLALIPLLLSAQIIPHSDQHRIGGFDAVSEGFSLLKYGALCDGTTDDAVAIQAASDAAEVSGGVVVWPTGTCAIGATIEINSPNVTWIGRGYGATKLKALNSTNLDRLVRIDVTSGITIQGIGFDCNRANQSSNNLEGLYIKDSHTIKILHNKFEMCGRLISHAGLDIEDTSNMDITGNFFASNFGYDLLAQHFADDKAMSGLRIIGNQFGASEATAANTKIDPLDTQGAGSPAVHLLRVIDSVFKGNVLNGARRPAASSPGRSALSNFRTVKRITISGNSFTGMSNAYSTIDVTNASGTITCNDSNCFFSTDPSTNRDTDVGSILTVEGDETRYVVTAVASETSLTVTPVMVRATGTDFRYRMNYSADLLGVSGENIVVADNTLVDSHDLGMNVSTTDGDAKGIVINGNAVSGSCIGGIVLFCTTNDCFDIVITNNTVKNSGQCTDAAVGLLNGITLHAGSTIQRCIIANNILFDDQAVPTQQDGIGCFDCTKVDNNTFSFNLFDGNVSEKIASGISRTTNAIIAAASEKVGIGTTDPDALFHVSGGDILIDNATNIRMKDAGGTARQVLTTTSGDAVELINNTAGDGGPVVIKPLSGGVESARFNSAGGLSLIGEALSDLGTPADGTIKFCNDCLKGSDPCAASSDGAIANRLNGAWQCP